MDSPAVMKIKSTPSSRRRILLRFLAILLGFTPLIAVELTLRILQLPRVASSVDPLVDLHHLQPLFELNAEGNRFQIAPERMNLFRPASFLAKKSPGVFRIFALGGSTTQGEPYSTETAFPEWLKLNLETATRGQAIESINCGGLSYASYRVRAILEEVLNYQPDLIVLYTGQNEFLERRSYDGWRSIPLPLARIDGALMQLRTVQLARSFVEGSPDRHLQPPANRTQLQREVDALLDYSGGLEAYHRHDPWREPVTAHFRWNLQQMVARCQASSVPIVLVRPVVNLLDCPPMKFESRSDLTSGQLAEFNSAWSAAQSPAATPEQAMDYLEKARAIDGEHAGVLFFLGRLASEAGDWDKAATFLRAAKDYDVCPLRAPSSIQQCVNQVAQEFGVPMVDADQLFIDRSPHGLVGNRWLVDHVHPTIEGHQVLGEALCEVCLEQGWLPTRDPQWRENRRDRVRNHFSSLGEDYFHRGKQRLEGLLLWTQGRAKKIRPQF